MLLSCAAETGLINMEWMILRRLKERNSRILLYILVLEIVLLLLQYALTGEFKRENLKVVEAREEILRVTSENTFLKDRLSRYGTSLAELESALPRNVESETAAAGLVAARLRDHGILAVTEEAVHNGKEIGIVVCGESTYTDMFRFFTGLQQDAPAVGVSELLVRALDGDNVSFSAKIVFFWTASIQEEEHGSI